MTEQSEQLSQEDPWQVFLYLGDKEETNTAQLTILSVPLGQKIWIKARSLK